MAELIVLAETTILCDVCRRDAAIVKFEEERHAKDCCRWHNEKISRYVITVTNDFSGQASYYYGPQNLKETKIKVERFIGSLGAEDARNRLIAEFKNGRETLRGNWMDVGGQAVELPFWCLRCNKLYCPKEWGSVRLVYGDEGDYKFTLGTCPKGHIVFLDAD